MAKRIGVIVFFALLICYCAYAKETPDAQEKSLEDGSYDFRLISPEMTEEDKDITVSADLSQEQGSILVETEGLTGNDVILKGIVIKNSIKMGMTGTEDGSVLSLHYTGSIESNEKAKGDFHCFIDSKLAFSGEWVLTKKRKRPEDERKIEDEQSEAEGDKEAMQAVQKLFKAMHLEVTFSQTIQEMVDMQIKQNPMLAQYKQTMLDFFKKYMSWDSIKDEMAKIYMEEFSTEEIKKLTDFYKTPIGEKAALKVPKLARKGAELGAKRVRENITELQRMITDKMKGPEKVEEEAEIPADQNAEAPE